MSRIQITDLNSSDFGFLSELTDEQMLDINGGGWLQRILGAACIIVGICTANVGMIAAGGVILANDDGGNGW